MHSLFRRLPSFLTPGHFFLSRFRKFPDIEARQQKRKADGASFSLNYRGGVFGTLLDEKKPSDHKVNGQDDADDGR